MKIRYGFAAAIVLGGMLPCGAVAQGTKLWTVSRYDEAELGTTDGVAIRSDGRMEAGPATSLLYESGGNYVWSVAADAAGNVYAGLGGTAAGGAVVMRVAGGAAGKDAGKATKVFESKELGVQALRVGNDGAVYAATSPDGKVYRLGATAADTVVVFDPGQTAEKPKYLWDVVQAPGKGGDLYVAAGAPAVVYRVPVRGGAATVAYKTVDQHIRCLLMAADGMLWAGSDGSGVVYRFDTKTAGAKPFAAFAAPKKEITSLATDAAGNVYAAGVGTRPAVGVNSPGLPPLPVTGAVGVTITFSQPGSANAANTNTLIPEGSEIYRIAPDGSPDKLVALKDDIVYALAVRNGKLLAATGNRGRVYAVDTAATGEFTDLAHLEAAQGMAFAAGPAGVFVATSNSGRVYRMDDKPAANATYTSEVFDAHIFSQWGRVEKMPTMTAGFDLFVRTGNVESPLMGWSEWAPVSADGAVTVPGGRFAQWKALLRGGAGLESVGLNYLEKNLAPVVDEVMVQPGARAVVNPPQLQGATVQINFPAPANGQAIGFVPDLNAQPLMAQKDKSAVTVRWAAHDENGDDLTYSVWYRGVGEVNWRLLKRKVKEKFLSFDALLLPDGIYQVKVVASDAPSHTDAQALTGEMVSDQFVVDTTPPGIANLHLSSPPLGVTSTPSYIHVTADATDLTSPIARAEYSVDAGPWRYLEPANRISDSKSEHYAFDAPLGIDYSHQKSCEADGNDEHILAMRVYDRYENVGTAKAAIDRLCISLTTQKSPTSK